MNDLLPFCVIELLVYIKFLQRHIKPNPNDIHYIATLTGLMLLSETSLDYLSRIIENNINDFLYE